MGLKVRIMMVVTMLGVFFLTPFMHGFVCAAPVPDTGQAKSFTKLDANGNDLPEEAPSWVMVRQNETGLIWEVKTDDGSIHDKDNTYTWQAAQDVFIAALNAQNFGGHSDWRLPTVKEISLLVDCSIPFPDPTINTDYFLNTVPSRYWTSTTYVNSPTFAWVSYFYTGSVDIYSKSTYLCYVRAVRGGECGEFGNFIDNGDGTVTDTATGLMWQQDTAPGTYTWLGAVSYCESSTLGGYNDWRLPNRNELQSLIDYSRFNPAVDPVFNTVLYLHWSSSIYANAERLAWLVNFINGELLENKRTYYYYVRAVRGGECGSFGDLDDDCRIDCIDNCLSAPNSLYSGNCTMGTIAESCTGNEQCGPNGVCSMHQEDIDNDGIGDACDECTDTDKDGYGDPGFLLNNCSEDNCPAYANGSIIGICVKTLPVGPAVTYSYRIGDPKNYITCTSDADCTATNGTCQTWQGDWNANGCGDVCECLMDCNNAGAGDGKITGLDLNVHKLEYGRSDCSPSNLCYSDGNEDGKVTGIDLLLYKNEYGRNDCPKVP